jgi:radical SAM superfamily enzyme YgiQ (UPF0313 family)
MKVLFVQEIFFEELGVMSLSACLRQAGIATDVLIESRIDRVLKHVRFHRPDVVAFSVVSGGRNFPVQVSRAIKDVDPSIATIAGGPHPTFFPDYLEEGDFDAVCIGEGEEAIVAWCKAIAGEAPLEAVPNIRYRKGARIIANPLAPLANLDALPFPDRLLYRRYRTFLQTATRSFLTSRGCPKNCTFCYNRSAKRIYRGMGRFCRMRSPAGIIEEILEVKAGNPKFRTVLFAGDMIFSDKTWALDFLNQYRERIDLPFSGPLDANAIDEEVGEALRAAGCHSIFFGIETGSEDVRKRILRKPVSNEAIIRAADILRRNGISFRTFNILGIPTETIDDMFETMRLNARIGTRHPYCSIFVPYPGTELFEIAVEAGEVSPSFSFADLPSSFLARCVLDRPDRHRIENLHKLFSTGVKHPELIPLIRRLIELPPNLLFRLWFGFDYMRTIQATERRSLVSVLPIMLRNMRMLIGGNGA